MSASPEIDLQPGTLVVADLHLDVGPHGGEHSEFVDWSRSLDRVPRLIVLGDLFDAWIGPAQAQLPSAVRVIDALRDLARRGTQVDLLAGNRDFLLERRFEQLTGARVHRAGVVGAWPGAGRVLFVHGDELCTLDRAYQRLRRVLRSRPVTWTVPRLPRPIALGIARGLRRASVQALAAKPPAEKEQQACEARRLAALCGCPVVVCGHAHAFRDESPAPGLRWIVLGAFGGPSDLLRVGARGELEVLASGAHRDAPNP